MTNLDKWRHYTRFLFSPQTYIDFGWRYTVAAALQRRVWYGTIEGDPLFPNLHIVFIGDAGVGKGLVLGKVTDLMRYHVDPRQNEVDRLACKKFLFPPGPDDLTYEKLCEKLSKSTQWVKKINGAGEKIAYSHASMSFVLEELGSLFKRRNDDSLNKLFLKCYDCKDHDYQTRHQGEHAIRKPCMSLLAGATPDFLPRAVRNGILEDGTVSRMIFIYEWEPRITQFFLGQPGEDELSSRTDLLNHLKVLSELFGEVKLASDVHSFLESWYKTTWKEKVRRCHPKMRTYFARSRVHILKLAMACHFSDNLDMVLTVEDCQTALDMLDKIEGNMALCLSSAGRNELNKLAKDILNFIATAADGFVTLPDLLVQYQTEIDYQGLRTLLEDLRIMGKIQEKDGTYTASSI